jgi:hypothetical protein
MRTSVEFVSDAFPAYPGEEEAINPGVWGKRLAEYLAAELPKHGFTLDELYAEDWGWELPLKNLPFPAYVQCGGRSREGTSHFVVGVDPEKPIIRFGWFWLRKAHTEVTINEITNALDQILRAHEGIRDLEWQA